jgi:hypothetical protein
MTMDITIEEVYAKYIKDLSPAEKLRLLEITAHDLANKIDNPEHSILELEGLGIEAWQEIDPQKYINQLRDEWDHRS